MRFIYNIYYRSILLFPLLTNSETGGIIASAEIDENFNLSDRQYVLQKENIKEIQVTH